MPGEGKRQARLGPWTWPAGTCALQPALCRAARVRAGELRAFGSVPALVFVAVRRWTQTLTAGSLSHVLCGNRANAPSVTSHRRWGCESMRATEGRVFSATLQGDTEVVERGGQG